MASATAVDVSHHNVIKPDEFPWDLIDAVLVKISEGDYFEDGRWKEHVDYALERGKIVYGYHFYRTKLGSRIVPPIDQAQFYLHALGDYKSDIHGEANDFENPFYWDNNPKLPYNPRLGAEAQDLEKFHQVWYEDDPDIHQMIYTNPYSWNSSLRVVDWLGRGPKWITEKPYLSDTTGLWIAHWFRANPYIVSPFKSWFLHQNTNKMLVDGKMLPGVYTEVTNKPRSIDGNECSLTNEQWRAFVGADEIPPPPPPEPPQPPAPPPSPPNTDEAWNAALDAVVDYAEGLKK